MAPQVKHDGFLVPNAGGSGVLPRMAEVDQVDFNTLSQTHKYAVVGGLQGLRHGDFGLHPGGGIALVNGELVKRQSQPALPTSAAGLEQDRFDLIAVATDGNLKRIDGVPSFDPVFPDPPVRRDRPGGCLLSGWCVVVLRTRHRQASDGTLGPVDEAGGRPTVGPQRQRGRSAVPD